MTDDVPLKGIRECSRKIRNTLNVAPKNSAVHGFDVRLIRDGFEIHSQVIRGRKSRGTNSQEDSLICQGDLACAEGGIHHRFIRSEIVSDDSISFLERDISIHVAFDDGRPQPLGGCGVVHHIGPHDPSGRLLWSEHAHLQRLF